MADLLVSVANSFYSARVSVLLLMDSTFSVLLLPFIYDCILVTCRDHIGPT